MPKNDKSPQTSHLRLGTAREKNRMRVAIHVARNQSLGNLFHVRSLSLSRERWFLGRTNLFWQTPTRNNSLAIHLGGQAQILPSPQVKAAQRAGGNTSKPTDAQTEKGGHEAGRVGLTPWSLGPGKTQWESIETWGWGGDFFFFFFFNDMGICGGKAFKSLQAPSTPHN